MCPYCPWHRSPAHTHSQAPCSGGTMCQLWLLLPDRNQTAPAPLTVLLLPPGKEHRPCFCSQAPGLLYQPSCFSSGKAPNAKSPRGNHKKFKPPLASQFPATASHRTPAQELPQCDRTAMVAQESTSPLSVTGNNSRAEILHFLDSHSSQLNWFQLYFAPCLQISITQTL